MSNEGLDLFQPADADTATPDDLLAEIRGIIQATVWSHTDAKDIIEQNGLVDALGLKEESDEAEFFHESVRERILRSEIQRLTGELTWQQTAKNSRALSLPGIRSLWAKGIRANEQRRERLMAVLDPLEVCNKSLGETSVRLSDIGHAANDLFARYQVKYGRVLSLAKQSHLFPEDIKPWAIYWNGIIQNGRPATV